jgi:hypothetical protein
MYTYICTYIHTIAQVYRAVVRPEFALKGDPNRVVAVKVCVYVCLCVCVCVCVCVYN